MIDREKELLVENERLEKENVLLKEKIEKYERMEVELSTTIDLLREGAIK